MINNPEKKIPKRRIRIKKDPYVLSVKERYAFEMEREKKVKNKKLNRKHKNKFKQDLEENQD